VSDDALVQAVEDMARVRRNVWVCGDVEVVLWVPEFVVAPARRALQRFVPHKDDALKITRSERWAGYRGWVEWQRRRTRGRRWWWQHGRGGRARGCDVVVLEKAVAKAARDEWCGVHAVQSEDGRDQRRRATRHAGKCRMERGACVGIRRWLNEQIGRDRCKPKARVVARRRRGCWPDRRGARRGW